MGKGSLSYFLAQAAGEKSPDAPFSYRTVAATGAKYPCLVRACTFGRATRTTRRRHAPSRLEFLEVYPIVYWLDSSS